MNDESDLLTPPKRLAIAYTGAAERPLFQLLLEFDARLAQIVGRDGEVVIAQMRMAWWRDVISKSPESRPSGEPMVARLNEIETIGASQGGQAIGAAMSHIIDAWDMLLAQEDWDQAALTGHAEAKARALFPVELDDGKGDASFAGQIWALHDLHNCFGVNVAASLSALDSVNISPPKPRNLSILAMAARQQYNGTGALSALRLFLHGLTGY